MAQSYLPPSPASPRSRKPKKVLFRGSSPGDESVTQATTGSSRCMSASEVARNLKHFETWATHQACEQVAFSDLPEELAADVADVFNLSARIPISWVDDNSTYSQSAIALSPALIEFLQSARIFCPELFSNLVTYNAMETQELFEELTTVRLAWNRLQNMRRSGERWSEADYAANVYNLFRCPAIRRSTYRYQCPISLPEPHERPSGEAQRILHAKSAIPDCSIFIKSSSIRHLSQPLKSPYKTLNVHPAIVKHSRIHLEHSFRFQSTPCMQPPLMASFEFASSFWEDKKPAVEQLDHAYRQNRMSTAAAARMLYSLRISSCVFGLIWADGTVQAHVDWCTADERKCPTVFSAPYPGLDDDMGPVFHKWNLDRPSDILQVYFLLRNIDIWTSTTFRDHIVAGIESFSQAILRGEREYQPWKRTSNARLHIVTEGKENNIPIPGPSTKGIRGRTMRRGR